MEFKNRQDPSMEELIEWFYEKYPVLVSAMRDSDHANTLASPNPYHIEGDVWTHTMMVCQNARHDNKILKISALLHDIGKPSCRKVIDANALKPNPSGESREESAQTQPSGKKKVHFRGHEGVSAWMSLDILKNLSNYIELTDEEIFKIFRNISLHGTLFNNIKDGEAYKPETVYDRFDCPQDFYNYVKQVKNDSLGRFHATGKDRSVDLLDTLYTVEDFISHQNRKPLAEKEFDGTLTILIGQPGSGKSTYAKNNNAGAIINRDEVLMEVGAFLYGALPYTKLFEKLQQEGGQKKVDQEFNRRAEEIFKNEKDIVIDMTSMSKKSRKRWLAKAGKRKKKAVLFLTNMEELFRRNEVRYKEEGKIIPEEVYFNMAKSFLCPTKEEGFDVVEYIIYKEKK